MKDFKNYNKYFKDNVTSIKSAYIHGKLYHLYNHDCPAIIDGTDKVYGEVIEFIDDSKKTLLNEIDHFEKYFFDINEIIYERHPVDVYYSNNDKEKLSFYKLINLNVLKNEYIESGNWKDYLLNSKRIVL